MGDGTGAAAPPALCSEAGLLRAERRLQNSSRILAERRDALFM